MKGDPAMSDPRDPALKQAVDRLMRDGRSLHDLFLLNYRDEANRPKLRSGFDIEGTAIQNNLHTLISRTQLKSALNTPNSNYNQFISAWNNGTGVLLSSFNRLTEFWSSLQTAQPELDRLMVPQPGPGPQPTPRHRGTAEEVSIFTRFRLATSELYIVFEACVKKQPASTSKIREHVRVIGELLNNSSLGPDTRMLLTNSKTEWEKFIIQYKNGAGIDWSCLQQLGHFQTDADLACFKFLGG
jgi:hypothetical protein